MKYRSAWLLTGVRRYGTYKDRNIGFLGLGNMGGYMAANLVKKVGFFTVYLFKINLFIIVVKL